MLGSVLLLLPLRDNATDNSLDEEEEDRHRELYEHIEAAII